MIAVGYGRWPLNGLVVVVRSGGVCKRPAGPLRCVFPHKWRY